MKDGNAKARLVARGYEDNNSDRTDSPTCSKMNLRLIVAIAASKNWQINSLDVQSAFLQGQKMERDVFLKPPPEANTSDVWHLKKCVYGLNEAARKWYLRLSEELAKLGVMKSKYDGAIFYWRKDNQIGGIMTAHVDDFFWAGTEEFKTSIVSKLTDIFKISSEQKASFKYIGIQISQEKSKIRLNQDAYIRNIKEVRTNGEGYRWRQVDPEGKEEFRSIIGQLIWISSQTRPDLAYTSCELSNSYKNAVGDDLRRANKAIVKAQHCSIQLNFSNIKIEESRLVIFSDASYRNLPDGGSQGGFIIFLSDNDGNCSPVHWQSRKLRRVVNSTLAAECLALQEAAEHGVYLKTVMQEILGDRISDIPVDCYTDNKSLEDSLYSTKTLENKRLILDLATIKDMLQSKEIQSVRWIDKHDQLADCLTKQTASSQVLQQVLQSGKLHIDLE